MTLKELAASCTDLKGRYPYLAFWGIAWLHFTNARHPVQKALLKGEKKYVLWELILRMGWLTLAGLHVAALISFWKGWYRKEWRRHQGERFDLVGKSWGFPDGKLNSHDFYWGDLQSKLSSQGFKMLLLCGNVGRKRWRRFMNKYAQGSEGKLPDIYLLSVGNVVAALGNQMRTSICLYLAAWLEKRSLERAILFRASVDCLRRETMFNVLHYWIGRRAVRLWRPKAFLMLYEGYAWERCLKRGVKEEDTNCPCIGYQHTVILPRAFAMWEKDFSPDVVLCTGAKTQEMIRNGSGKGEATLVAFGSFRFTSAHQPRLAAPRSQSNCVLVIPEGIVEEVDVLFQTAIETAGLLPDFHFIFRLHPVLQQTIVERDWLKRISPFPNVELSQRTAIEEDFKRASFILYRGSSAVLYAVLSGLKPYYLEGPDVPFVDPLFELQDFRERVASAKDLVGHLERFREGRPESFQRDWQKAASYVESYTRPVGPASIQQLITLL